MLVKLAEAIGRLVLAGRELTRLAGFTSRVTELMTVLKDLNNGRYQRTMVSIENGMYTPYSTFAVLFLFDGVSSSFGPVSIAKVIIIRFLFLFFSL